MSATEKKSLLKRIPWRATLIGAALIVVGMFAAIGIGAGLHFTNELEFCTACHSMGFVYEEYKETVHYKNRTGVRAICSDCHVPKPLGPKLVAKVLAYKDVMHELLGTINTPEKFEEHRWEMANRVWDKMRATDSRECKSCHKFEQMDLSAQGRMARSKHGREMDEGEKACIDCHSGIAHELPEEPEEPEAKKAEEST